MNMNVNKNKNNDNVSIPKITINANPNSNSITNTRIGTKNQFYKNKNRNPLRINFKNKLQFKAYHLNKKYFFRKHSNLELKKHCFIYIRETLNNTFITVRNKNRRLIIVKSCGTIGFKGPKRGTHYATGELAKNIKQSLKKTYYKRTATIILLSKLTKYSKIAIKNLSYQYGLRILEIIERIPIPHNGLRKPHVRRK